MPNPLWMYIPFHGCKYHLYTMIIPSYGFVWMYGVTLAKDSPIQDSPVSFTGQFRGFRKRRKLNQPIMCPATGSARNPAGFTS